jgi:Ribbon-helix-helix domain
MKSPVVKRSIIIGKHKTSVSLEEAFWRGLKDYRCQPPCAAPEFGRQYRYRTPARQSLIGYSAVLLDYYQKGTASPNRSFVAADQHQAAH